MQSSAPVAAPVPSHSGQVGRGTQLLNSSILAALQSAKIGVTGIGIPGVEPIINGVLELGLMVLTMKDNKENLAQLRKSLDDLINLDIPGPSGDLHIRIAKLSAHLKVIAAECQSLAEESSLKRFFLSKVYKEKIQGIRIAVTVQIEEFVFYSNVSIEKLVQAIGKSVEGIQPKGMFKLVQTPSN
ncbi:hypothetical protein MVEN_01682300 [Mycena venus]|uniref:Uncharacterized protein n=1 Tax=Mycena venus TaxID=2733690 RepID=A0A8H6XNZ7_9AGAR|nr:hypothetical protein MVEN_01682300 [Mycena venus]